MYSKLGCLARTLELLEAPGPYWGAPGDVPFQYLFSVVVCGVRPLLVGPTLQGEPGCRSSWRLNVSRMVNITPRASPSVYR